MLFQGIFISLIKWAGPISENIFYSTKNVALSDRIGFAKIQDVFFSNSRETFTNFVNLKKKFFDIVIAT